MALQAAYDEGEPWLNELKDYLHGNYKLLLDYFENQLPQFPVSKLEGTYLVWVDVSALGMPSEEIEKSLIENEKVWINGGTMYGRDGFVRINIACPMERLEEGLHRIGKGFKRLLDK
jgi:cystathionine beta-lyase